MKIRKLTARDAQAMADIHAASFERPWPALDMSVHIERDLCLGLGSPLQSFLILRGTDLHSEVLPLQPILIVVEKASAPTFSVRLSFA